MDFESIEEDIRKYRLELSERKSYCESRGIHLNIIWPDFKATDYSSPDKPMVGCYVYCLTNTERELNQEEKEKVREYLDSKL
ncbi:hypothetical protein K8R47_02615 [archaeon]|nr:hypothetical protein [archaeon]